MNLFQLGNFTLHSGQKSHWKIDETGCWLWCGCTNSSGYGQLRYNGKTQYAHRVAWVETYGPIPSGLDVCHSCDRKICINPAHLFLGTRLDNMRDCVAKGRQQRGEKHKLAKLTDVEVARIRSLKGMGLTYREIGAQFGVSYSNIGYIMRGDSRRVV